MVTTTTTTKGHRVTNQRPFQRVDYARTKNSPTSISTTIGALDPVSTLQPGRTLPVFGPHYVRGVASTNRDRGAIMNTRTAVLTISITKVMTQTAPHFQTVHIASLPQQTLKPRGSPKPKGNPQQPARPKDQRPNSTCMDRQPLIPLPVSGQKSGDSLRRGLPRTSHAANHRIGPIHRA